MGTRAFGQGPGRAPGGGRASGFAAPRGSAAPRGCSPRSGRGSGAPRCGTGPAEPLPARSPLSDRRGGRGAMRGAPPLSVRFLLTPALSISRCRRHRGRFRAVNGLPVTFNHCQRRRRCSSPSHRAPLPGRPPAPRLCAVVPSPESPRTGDTQGTHDGLGVHGHSLAARSPQEPAGHGHLLQVRPRWVAAVAPLGAGTAQRGTALPLSPQWSSSSCRARGAASGRR